MLWVVPLWSDEILNGTTLYAGEPLSARQKKVELLSPRSLSRWDIPSGDYSGITPVSDNRYAVVSDKSAIDGFYTFRIKQDRRSGQVVEVSDWAAFGDSLHGRSGRDQEGIAFFPSDSTLWISGEADQRIPAYRLDGSHTGQELSVPEICGKEKIYPNYGFEALTYDNTRNLFWTVTENVLKADGRVAAPGSVGPSPLRLLALSPSGAPVAQYTYWLDEPETRQKGRQYAFGVVALCALDDGRLLVLEREFDVPKRYLKSTVHEKLYMVRPDEADTQSSAPKLNGTEGLLRKELVTEWTTRMRLIRPRLANYEGMCRGIVRDDGRQTLLLVSDSQGGYGKKFCHLRDWIRVIVLP